MARLWKRRILRENESVPVEPAGVLGVEGHELVEQDVGDGSHAHGRTGVAGVCLGGGIDLNGDVSSIVLFQYELTWMEVWVCGGAHRLEPQDGE